MSSSATGAISYVEALDKLEDILKKSFRIEARYEAETLLAEFLDISKPNLYASKNKNLSFKDFETLEKFATRRALGEPLQYILGWSEFLGMRLEVGPEVLIPRLDSESMVLQGVEHLQSLKLQQPKVLDLGAGSGALGMAVLNLIPQAKLWSVELSPGAFKLLNANSNKLNFESRLEALALDLDKPESFEAISQKQSGFDLILANPPYIDPEDLDLDAHVKSYEPRLALFASEKGLEKIINWSQKSTGLLSSRGIYFCEIGWKQGPALKEYFERQLPKNFLFSLHKDLSGNERFFSLKRA